MFRRPLLARIIPALKKVFTKTSSKKVDEPLEFKRKKTPQRLRRNQGRITAKIADFEVGQVVNVIGVPFYPTIIVDGRTETAKELHVLARTKHGSHAVPVSSIKGGVR